LAGGQQICIHGCSRSDLWQLELVSEPYGYDLVFVATPNLATGGVYFTRKHQGTLDDTRTALLRKAIENASWQQVQSQASAPRPNV